ncbi:MAG: PilZ domain-containing protein [Nitrospirota bacterium]
MLVHYQGTTYELYSENLSERGIYVVKKDPFPVGSDVEVTLPIWKENTIKLNGEVVHIRGLFGDVFKLLPGMGIRFKKITDDKLNLLRNYLEKLIASDILDNLKEIIIKD